MRLDKLDRPVDLDHDHVMRPSDAELTLVEYGSYSCGPCHAVHEVIEELRNRTFLRESFLRVDTVNLQVLTLYFHAAFPSNL